MAILGIVLGILISCFNLFFMLRAKKHVYFILIRYLLISFMIYAFLCLSINPIFLALGFTIFPFLVAIRAIRRKV